MSVLQELKNWLPRWSGLLLVALLLVMDPVTGAATPALQPLFEQALEALSLIHI